MTTKKIQSNPTIYSRKDKFIPDKGDVKINTPFILTGRGSKCVSGNIRYYWRLVKGTAPGITGIIEDGCTIKFLSPPKPAEIVFELKVKDLETEEEATKNITIQVTDE